MNKYDIIGVLCNMYFKETEVLIGKLNISSYCEEGDWVICVRDTTTQDIEFYCYLDAYADNYQERVEMRMPEISPDEMYNLIFNDFDFETIPGEKNKVLHIK